MTSPATYGTFTAEPDLSREQAYDIYMNMRELGWHETEFLHRTSFTYVIRGKEDDKPSYRGCVYLFPTSKRDYDVEVYLWVTRAVPDDGLEADVLAWTQRWIDSDWPFERPLFPHHIVSWDEYEKLSDGRSYTRQH